jgi:hypothetical protein
MENFAIGVSSSIVGGIILIIFGKWKGWWWKEKSQASIDLAIKSLKILEDELDQKQGIWSMPQNSWQIHF